MGQIIRARWLWLAVVAVALATVTVKGTALEAPQIAPVAGFVQELLAPVEGALFRVTASLRNAGTSVSEWRQVRREKARLEEQLQRLELLESQAEELRQENRRLKELLAFKENAPGLDASILVAARAVGRNPDNWFSYLMINKGSRDGLARNQAVLTARGLVGRITRVTPNTATVMLLTDPQSGVGAMVQREPSRTMGVILAQESRGDRLRMKFFKRDADVKPGDRIVTSGLGRNYPAGLPIGTVTSVSDGEDGLVRYAWVRALANLDRLEEVLVLTSPAAEGAPEAAAEVAPEGGR